ncbi:MAG: endonuclease/exonuclease/phosphatase family protein, partial [Chloroflexota bacterium]
MGYIDRGAQRVRIRVGDRRIAVVNVHLEAFDQQARREQACDLAHFVQSIDDPWVLGGDFNAPPPEAEQKKDFHDEPVDYTSDQTLELLRAGLGASCEAFGELDGTRSDLPTLTYPADRPNRRLDHVFASSHFVMTQTRVLREAGDASDH